MLIIAVRAVASRSAGMRNVALLASAAVLLNIAVSSAQMPNLGGGDVFNSTTAPADSKYGTDPECAGTYRRYYDEMYGRKATVMSGEEMARREMQGESLRCGMCGPNKVICWSWGVVVPRTTELPRRPPPSPPVVLAARIAADAIIQGSGDVDRALLQLNKAKNELPPYVPRPIQCWDMMIDARSKRNI